jgi:hypothetical protein
VGERKGWWRRKEKREREERDSGWRLRGEKTSSRDDGAVDKDSEGERVREKGA